MSATVKLFVTTMLVLLVSAASTQADIFFSNRQEMPRYIFKIASQSGWSGGDGLIATEITTDDTLRVFCSDLFTMTSGDFQGGIGQAYDLSTLADSTFHTDLQKAQLQSLFDHVYTKAYYEDYSPNNELYANIFQMAVWEIIHDSADFGMSTTTGHITLTNKSMNTLSEGEFVLSSSAEIAMVRNTLESWFDAIANNSWEALGYDYDPVTVTVWMAEGGTHVSQTLIGVDHRPPPEAAVPEPATLAIVGLGLAGLGAIRARRRK